MKNIILNKTRLVALTLAAATLVTPLYASAQDFSSRRSNNDAGAQIAGGLIGGSFGAILGEEIAGRGNRTEGAILGAIIGGVAGAAVGEGIADDGNKNRRSNRRFTNNRGFSNNRGFNNNRRFTSNRGFNNNRRFGNNRGFNNRSFNNSGFRNNGFGNGGFRNSGVTTRVVHHDNGFNNFGSRGGFRNDPGYGKRTSANIYHKIDKIDYRIDVLKYEQKEIYAEIEYNGRNRRLKDRLYYIDCEIVELNDRRHFLKRKLKRNKRRSY